MNTLTALIIFIGMMAFSVTLSKDLAKLTTAIEHIQR